MIAALNGNFADYEAKEGEPGYVKNRTHWVEIVMTPVIDNQTFEFDTSYVAAEKLYRGQYQEVPYHCGRLWQPDRY